MERDDLFAGSPIAAQIGPTVSGQDWAHGKPVLDVSRITQYQEQDPRADIHLHKPWRRVFFLLNTANGSEYTFDSDQ